MFDIPWHSLHKESGVVMLGLKFACSTPGTQLSLKNSAALSKMFPVFGTIPSWISEQIGVLNDAIESIPEWQDLFWDISLKLLILSVEFFTKAME